MISESERRVSLTAASTSQAATQVRKNIEGTKRTRGVGKLAWSSHKKKPHPRRNRAIGQMRRKGKEKMYITASPTWGVLRTCILSPGSITDYCNLSHHILHRNSNHEPSDYSKMLRRTTDTRQLCTQYRSTMYCTTQHIAHSMRSGNLCSTPHNSDNPFPRGRSSNWHNRRNGSWAGCGRWAYGCGDQGVMGQTDGCAGVQRYPAPIDEGSVHRRTLPNPLL